MSGIIQQLTRAFRSRHHSGFRALLSNSGWMMGEQVFRLLIGLFVGVWIARELGPSMFGQLSYAIAFATIFGIVVTLGMNRVLVREMVAGNQPNVIEKLMSTAFVMRILAATVVYVLCMGAAWLSGEEAVLLIGLIAGSYFFSASDCIELYFQSRVQARVTASARLFSFMFVTTVRVALLLAGADVVAFAAATLLEYAAAALVLHLVYRRSGQKFSWSAVEWSLAGKLLSECWPEIIAGFSALLFMRMDQVMLQHMSGSEAVGIFSVASRLSESWYFVPASIVASTFPAIVAVRSIDTHQYMKRLQLLMVGLVVISYAAIIVTTLFAEPVIDLLYGSPYDGAAQVLIVHIWCGLFLCFGLSSGSWIMAEKKVHLNLYRNLAGLSVNAVMNFLLIPRYGATGAAYATLSGLMVAFFLFDLVSPPMREISRQKWRALLILPVVLAR